MEKKIIKGKVININVSKNKGTSKKSVPSAKLIENVGIENDAHANFRHRQISLLSIESIEKMKTSDLNFNPGDFAENLTTKGLNLISFPIGTILKVGQEVILEISQIGKKCHTKCEIFTKVGNCIMPLEGVFAKVIKGGNISENDSIIVETNND